MIEAEGGSRKGVPAEPDADESKERQREQKDKEQAKEAISRQVQEVQLASIPEDDIRAWRDIGQEKAFQSILDLLLVRVWNGSAVSILFAVGQRLINAASCACLMISGSARI